jgi:competence protein ComEA
MRARHETLLATLLIAACALSGAAATFVRLAGRPVPALHAAPDLTVAVLGEVARPGSYRLRWGARVEDLLDAAGGVTPAADLALVAVAAPLTDGRTVIVPSSRSPEGDGRVDLNTASARLLGTLPGVGPVTAERIIARRPFHRLDDLLRVPGIGPARLEALRDRVTL